MTDQTPPVPDLPLDPKLSQPINPFNIPGSPDAYACRRPVYIGDVGYAEPCGRELPCPEHPAPVPGSSRRAPEPTDDEVAAEIDRAQEEVEAEAQAHAQGYAEAVARLRDDDRYRDWWTALPKQDPAYGYWQGPARRHLADYLETVGPDGPDVTTGRWPAREQAVIRAAIAWRKWASQTFTQDDWSAEDSALIGAVDALPAGESQASEPALTARCQCGHPHAAHEGPGRPGRRCVLCFGCNAYAAELPAQVTEPAPAAPKLAQGGRLHRRTGLPMVAGEQPDGYDGGRICGGCGQTAGYLSSRDWCDGCEEEAAAAGWTPPKLAQGAVERPIDLDDRAPRPGGSHG